MPKCMVIQPFDGGPYDARYDQVIAPAIQELDIEPYRVDRDPSSTVPIEAIERNIRDADFCLADITPDNPNVWYEVGYGFACGTDVILICSKERTIFPFDVRHRGIIRYGTQSPSDFAELKIAIADRLLALKRTEKRLVDVALIHPTEGLTQHEMTALVLLMGAMLEPDCGLSGFSLKQGMEKAFYNETGTAIAVRMLFQKKFIQVEPEQDSYGNQYDIFKISDLGMSWCLTNQDKLNLKHVPPPPRHPLSPRRPIAPPPVDEAEDDDIPF